MGNQRLRDVEWLVQSTNLAHGKPVFECKQSPIPVSEQTSTLLPACLAFSCLCVFAYAAPSLWNTYLILDPEKLTL